jgi:endonuclease-3
MTAAKNPASPKAAKALKPAPERIQGLFAALAEAIPNPTTELVSETPFQLLVAVVCSAQMTDAGVNRATEPLFKIIKTPADMLKLGEEALQEYLKSINYWRTKAKNVMALSQKLVERHNGEVPATREELETLPGVGRKTANVILNVLFHQPTIPVDTHVFRVSHRLGLATGATPEAVEAELEAVVPPAYRPDAHHLLILHGRYTCTAKAPKCATCPVAAFCPSFPLPQAAK